MGARFQALNNLHNSYELKGRRIMRDLRHSKVRTILVLALVGSGGFLFGTRAVPAQIPEGMEIQTRGPVHEAFAELIVTDAGQGMMAPAAPPMAIEEIPPEERPEGEDVAWIPGYWGWDEQRNDFLWISGVWRIPPPDCSWTPGYWVQAQGGAQWVAGYWLADEVQEVVYLPAPPESLEEGPQTDPPSPDHIWIPGSWVWPTDHYVWQPGYWMEASPDWVYTPTHYNWTPRGYVCVNGYWDYPIVNRGVLFAPVYFSQPVYSQPAFQYSPRVLIDVGGLTNNLFRHPRYNHYVFGDYYGDDSSRYGIVPWFEENDRYRTRDPIYAHQRWEHGRKNEKWSDELKAEYRDRHDRADARPPQVYLDSHTSPPSHPDGERRNQVRARTLEQQVQDKESSLRLIKIDQNERDTQRNRGRDLRKFADERVQRETHHEAPPAVVPAPDQPVKIERLPAPKSPIQAVRKPNRDKSRTPPTLPQIPKLEPERQAPNRQAQPAEQKQPPARVEKERPNNKQDRPQGNKGQGNPNSAPNVNPEQQHKQAPDKRPNQNQGASTPNSKENRRTQIAPPPVPLPVTAPPPEQVQEQQRKEGGNGKGQGKDKGKN